MVLPGITDIVGVWAPRGDGWNWVSARNGGPVQALLAVDFGVGLALARPTLGPTSQFQLRN